MVKKPNTEGGEGANELMAPVSKDDTPLVLRAIQDITGCGIPEAQARAKELTAEKLREIAELERTGKRAQIVAILFG